MEQSTDISKEIIEVVIKEIIKALGNDIVEEAKKNLQKTIPRQGIRRGRRFMYKGKSNTTGALAHSITYSIEGNKLILKTLGYGEQVDKGSKPHKVSPKVLEGWIKKKPIDLVDLQTGKKKPMTDKNVKTVAYLMSRKIGKYGTKGTGFLTNAIKNNLN